MIYEVRFSNQATKFIRKLQLDIQKRIKSKFREVADNPFRHIEHYEGNYYKIRIGDFRALIDIDNERKIIWVRVFDKRNRIYKR
ncbi:MAG: type II toxin-antitoxin system RelE/ParE family toxin [Nanoarchaeota archaeon]